MRFYEMTTPAFPLRSFRQVFHIGSMDAAQKGADSLEGAGLSISLHPQEWSEIARLSGPLWQGTRAGNQFLDVHRLRKAQRTAITQWGLANGYLIKQAVWRVSYFDDEYEEKRFFLFTDRAEAEAEAEEYGVRPTLVKDATDGAAKLWQRARHRPDPVMGFDLLCPIYAEDVLRVDGVWWADRLSPDTLSAPRGVIVPSQVRHWQFIRRTAAADA
jgi:hypothetical protein